MRFGVEEGHGLALTLNGGLWGRCWSAASRRIDRDTASFRPYVVRNMRKMRAADVAMIRYGSVSRTNLDVRSSMAALRRSLTGNRAFHTLE
jgi:hypothetical protein